MLRQHLATVFAISLAVTSIVIPRRGDAPVLVSMVLLHMVGFTILSQLALQVVPAGQSTVLAYTSVLWAPIGAAAVPRRKADVAECGRPRAWHVGAHGDL
jgi:drug/metabolite transporter (DMT)-like permease